MKPKEGDKKWKDGELWIYHIINDHDKGWHPASKLQLYDEIELLKKREEDLYYQLQETNGARLRLKKEVEELKK